MYAIIETGGKQYKVQNGDVIDVEKLAVEAGEKVVFDKVLVVSDENGIRVGRPYLEGVTVDADFIENGRGQKVIIFKYKSKKDYRKKQGHRQPYTRVEIKAIDGNADVAAPAEEKAEAAEDGKVSMSMKKDELVAYAEEHGIEIDPKATKAVIVDTINNAE